MPPKLSCCPPAVGLPQPSSSSELRFLTTLVVLMLAVLLANGWLTPWGLVRIHAAPRGPRPTLGASALAALRSPKCRRSAVSAFSAPWRRRR
eukprot:12477789-Alexandrium_andersonii.AAC.1